MADDEKKEEDDDVIKLFKAQRYERPKPREGLDYKGAAAHGVKKAAEKKKKAEEPPDDS